MHYIYDSSLSWLDTITSAIAFIKCPKATSKSFTRDIWLYDKVDFDRFNQMLTDINWNEKLCNFDDVDDMCEEF